jgi:hypothetical protein
MTRGAVCRQDIVQVFAGLKIRDFIAVGTDNNTTVLQGVVYKCAASLTPMLSGKKSFSSLELREITKRKIIYTLLESNSKSFCSLEHI